MPEELIDGVKKFRVTTDDERMIVDYARLYCGSGRLFVENVGYRRTLNNTIFYNIYNGKTCIFPDTWKRIKELAERYRRGERFEAQD